MRLWVCSRPWGWPVFSLLDQRLFSLFFFSFSEKHMRDGERIGKEKKQLTQKSQQTTKRSFDSRIRSTDRQRPRHRITTGKRSSNNRQQSHIKAQIESIHGASKEFPRRHDARVRDDVMVCHGVDGGTRSSLVIWWVGISVPCLHIYIPSFTLYTLGDEGDSWLVGWVLLRTWSRRFPRVFFKRVERKRPHGPY